MFGHYFEDSRYFVKVGDIATATIGLTYKPDNVTDEGIIVLRSRNIQNAELCLSDDTYPLLLYELLRPDNIPYLLYLPSF